MGILSPDAAAFGFLIISLAALIAAVGWALFGPSRYNLLERFLYAPVYTLSRILWRVEIEWDQVYPHGQDGSFLLTDRMAGGAVLVANHRCSMDPFFVQLIAGRRVHWMVASEYFKVIAVGGMLRAFEAIPTHRGGVDTASTKFAIRLARSGRYVGMFPEGRINRTDQPLMTIRPGAAMVALRSGVPLIPIWIDGAPVGPSIFSALFRAARIRVMVGAPDDWGLRQRQATAQEAGKESEVAKRDRGDRELSERWLRRVMEDALQRSGSSGHTIALAGKNWVEENG
jgi:1-acyl-sn-glycerol-3-phosphate acyltransferase